MKSVFLILGGLMLAALVGCAPTFAGEWLERPLSDAGPVDDALLGFRRAAFQFDPISTVRYGAFNEANGIVDASTVASDQYFLFDGGKTAQFGQIMARLEGNTLIASVSGGRERHFSRVNGKSIFPPLVVLPQMYGAAPEKSRPRYLSTH